MRIGVHGASGRIGVRLVEAILADPGLELAAALVSPTSKLIGRPVAGGSLEYRPVDPTMNCHCDVIIDFSTPTASLALQEAIGTKRQPVVVGTTGFDATQTDALERWSRLRPLEIVANFALGYDAFEAAVMGFARALPGAEPTVMETYHLRKKTDPSGTSKRLAELLRRARAEAGGVDLGSVPILVRREGEVVGITEVRFEAGVASTSFTHTVATPAAYAEGAIAGARRLVERARRADRAAPIPPSSQD
jgi:4-hydroxy-tetrahydrodipicolinate reductase